MENTEYKETNVKMYFTTPDMFEIVFEENGKDVYSFSLSIESAKRFLKQCERSIALAELRSGVTNDDKK